MSVQAWQRVREGSERWLRPAMMIALLLSVLSGEAAAQRQTARLIDAKAGFADDKGNSFMVPGRWNPLMVRIMPGTESEQCLVRITHPQDVTQRSEMQLAIATTPGRELVLPLVFHPSRSVREVRIELAGERSSDRLVMTWTGLGDVGTTSLAEALPEGALVVGDLGAGLPSEALDAWRKIAEKKAGGPTTTVRFPGQPVRASVDELAKVVKITPEEMPVSWAGLDMLDGLVVSQRAMSRLSAGQVDALWAWVMQGGRLAMVMDAPGELRISAAVRRLVPEVLEMREVGIDDGVSENIGVKAAARIQARSIGLRSGEGGEAGYAGWQARMVGASRSGRRDPGPVLWADGPVGGGMVAIAGFTPEVLAAAGLEAGPGVRERVMGAMLAGILDAQRKVIDEQQWGWQPRGDVLVVNGYLETAMRLQKIPDSVYWGLALLAAAVVILVGPVDYFVLGWFKKRAYSWLTALGWLAMAGGVGAVLPGLIRTDATQVVSGRVIDLVGDETGRVIAAASGQIAGVYSSEPQRMDALKLLGTQGGYFHGAAAEADWFGRDRETDQWTKPALVSVQTIGQEGLTTARSIPGSVRMPRWNLRCMMGQEVGIGAKDVSEVADGFERVRAEVRKFDERGRRLVVTGWPSDVKDVSAIVISRGWRQGTSVVSGGDGKGPEIVLEYVEPARGKGEGVLTHDVWKGPLAWEEISEMGLGAEVSRQNDDWAKAGSGDLWQLERIRRRDMAFIRRCKGRSTEEGGVMVILMGERERQKNSGEEGAGGAGATGAKVIRERFVVRTMAMPGKEQSGD